MKTIEKQSSTVIHKVWFSPGVRTVGRRPCSNQKKAYQPFRTSLSTLLVIISCHNESRKQIILDESELAFEFVTPLETRIIIIIMAFHLFLWFGECFQSCRDPKRVMVGAQLCSWIISDALWELWFDLRGLSHVATVAHTLLESSLPVSSVWTIDTALSWNQQWLENNSSRQRQGSVSISKIMKPHQNEISC